MTRPRRSFTALQAEADQLDAWQRDHHEETNAMMIRALATPVDEAAQTAGFFASDLAGTANPQNETAEPDYTKVERVLIGDTWCWRRKQDP
ncbi:MAG: hypothetical protein ACP5P1_14790 [Acidimicrobiales bacterium]